MTEKRNDMKEEGREVYKEGWTNPGNGRILKKLITTITSMSASR